MSRFRAIAVVTLLAVCWSAYGWTTCVGWQAGASMRAACCKAAGHSSAGAEADDCCAQGEQQRQASSGGQAPLAIVPPALPAAALLMPPRSDGARPVDRHFPDRQPHVATHLLFSVFLV